PKFAIGFASVARELRVRGTRATDAAAGWINIVANRNRLRQTARTRLCDVVSFAALQCCTARVGMLANRAIFAGFRRFREPSPERKRSHLHFKGLGPPSRTVPSLRNCFKEHDAWHAKNRSSPAWQAAMRRRCSNWRWKSGLWIP